MSETLIPILYNPTNVGQITLTDLFGNHAAAVAVLAVGFGLCTWGIPVTVLDGKPADVHDAMPGKLLPPQSQPEEIDAVSTKAEAGLYSEAVVIEEQARQAQPLKDGENLLPSAS